MVLNCNVFFVYSCQFLDWFTIKRSLHYSLAYALSFSCLYDPTFAYFIVWLIQFVFLAYFSVSLEISSLLVRRREVFQCVLTYGLSCASASFNLLFSKVLFSSAKSNNVLYVFLLIHFVFYVFLRRHTSRISGTSF